MALKMTVTPSTQYIEDSINIKITGGSIPSNYELYIHAFDNKTTQLHGAVVYPITRNLTSNFNIICPYTIEPSQDLPTYEGLEILYRDIPNSSQIFVRFSLYKPTGSNSVDLISEVWKTMYIKPEPPTFLSTPNYSDTNEDTLSITNDNQMLVNGQSKLLISGIFPQAHKSGSIKSIEVNGTDTFVYNSSSVIEFNIDNYLLNNPNLELSLVAIDSRGWRSEKVILADVSKFKYIWQSPKINNYTVEHDNISETTYLKANGYYSEGYKDGIVQLTSNYQYKENVEGSTYMTGATTLYISKKPSHDYDNFLAILQEYNNPTYVDVYNTDHSILVGQGYTDMTWRGVKDLFDIAVGYNDKYTKEYLQQDYQNIGSNIYYICYSGGYNGSWKQFWKDTLKAIYNKIIENGGNYEFEIVDSFNNTDVAIQGDTQDGFSIDKVFNIKLNVSQGSSGASSDFFIHLSNQTLLPTAVPAIDVYKSNVAIHGLYDENLGGTQINGNLFLNGEGLFEQKILWEGVFYMRDIHTITLSKNVSDTKHGIVLVWSDYNGSASDSNFFTYYIPKEMVALHNGAGYFMSMGGTEGIIAYKYVYVGNKSITGHANNSGTHSQGGLTYNNSRAVLRYVIEI